MRNFGISLRYLTVLTVFAVAVMAIPRQAAASRYEIDRDVDFALKKLYDSNPTARMLAANAKGILVFPDIVKGGFIFGAQTGKGALRVKGATRGYYRTVSVSYGLQAGVQSYGYVLFFMTDSALDYLDKHDGWEIGTGPR